jgi:hypothetical protein
VSSTTTLNPNDHHHAPSHVSDRVKSRLAIVAPMIGDSEPAATKDVHGIGKVDRSIMQRTVQPGRIERNLHLIIVPPKITRHQYESANTLRPALAVNASRTGGRFDLFLV